MSFERFLKLILLRQLTTKWCGENGGVILDEREARCSTMPGIYLCSVLILKTSSVDSAMLSETMNVTDRQTDRQTALQVTGRSLLM